MERSKWQYSIGIVFGLLVGAIVAVWVGNHTTAVLAGVLTAGVATWIVSLDWLSAKDFAISLAIKMSIGGLSAVRGLSVKGLWKFCLGCGEAFWIIAKSLFGAIIWIPKRIFYELPIWTYSDIVFRRVFAHCFSLVILIGILFVEMICMAFANFNPDSSIFVFTWLLFASFFVCYATINLLYFIGFVLFVSSKEKFIREILEQSLVDWIREDDNRGAIMSVVYMFKIRTINAFKIVAYLFVLFGWGFIALAGNKTRFSTLAAMVLSGFHLGVSYCYGWIVWGNINFILLLAVTMMLGALAGQMIYNVVEIKVPKFPDVDFLEHLSAP